MTGRTCGAVLEGGKNRGRVCGRDVRGFLAPGMGRCAYHLTDVERVRVRAIMHALRDQWSILDLARDPEDRKQHHEQPEGDEPTDSQIDFDPSGFVDPALDEE